MTKRIGMLVLSVAALLATASMAAAGSADDFEEESESAFGQDELSSGDESAFGQDELLSGDEEEFQEHGDEFDENAHEFGQDELLSGDEEEFQEDGEEFHENGDGFDAVEGGAELTDDGGLDREGVLSSNLEVLRCVDENTVLVKKTEILTMPLSDLAGHENGFAADEHTLGEGESEEDLLGSHGENGQMSSDMEIVRCVGEDTLLVRTTSLVPTTVLQEETMLETVQLDEFMHGEDDGDVFDSSFRQVDSLDNPFLLDGDEEEHEREFEDEGHVFGSEEDTQNGLLG